MNYEEALLEAPVCADIRTDDAPTAEEMRAELRRVIDSPDFPATPRNRAFLEYIVTRELAGEGESISAYAVATAVFGRSELFNSLLDPIVRIEAGKLRRDLETAIAEDPAFAGLLERVVAREIDPATAAVEILERRGER